ncbi:hypothetical protein EXIGLDRAFT_575095, partial [Exidia glandulosa HHB12029]
PSKPGYAFCVNLLDFCLALSYQAADSAQALAAALHTHHRSRGFVMRGKHGQPIQEGYRRTLQHALQWYGVLQHSLLLETDLSVRAAAAAASAGTPAAAPPDLGNSPPTAAPDDAPLHPPRQVDPYLVDRCPACFGGFEFGRRLDRGGDVHIAGDGNFMHRRMRSAGLCPPIAMEHRLFIPDTFVDAVGHDLDTLSARGPRSYVSEVPDAVLKNCGNSYTAADGSKAKTPGDVFDDTGLMAFVCRHDIPIYLCNIATPGEQQKFFIAGLIWILLHMPDLATIVTFYDINCVSWKMLMAYGILPDWMLHRLGFATSILHSYGHQWECQLVFNPRLLLGVGLTDGEGTERFWSRLRGMISILRQVSRDRRIVLLELHTDFVARVIRGDLGRWLVRRGKAVETRQWHAQAEVTSSHFSEAYLREQWSAQKSAQLSVRHTAPQLREQLDAVVELQEQIENLEKSISATASTFRRRTRAATRAAAQDTGDGTAARRGADAGGSQIALLRDTLRALQAQADELYGALNVGEDFPSIAIYGREFVKLLVMTHDAKELARAKVIARLSELDRLDQAVGGSGTPLGTTQHQKVCRTMRKRTPALVNAIQRYNDLCDRLVQALPQGLDFPLPEKLPVVLTDLKDNTALLENVWLGGVPESNAAWLTDGRVRRAIRALHTLDRCREESLRLELETKQIFGWFKRKTAALHVALQDPGSALLVF